MNKYNELPNGITVILGKNEKNHETLHMLFGFKFGSRMETAKTQGVVAVLINSFKQIAAKSGVDLYVHKGGDVTLFELETEPEHLEDVLRMMAVIFIDTRFPDCVLRKAVEDVLQEVRDNSTLIEKQMSLALKKAAFSKVVWATEDYCASVIKNANIGTLTAFSKQNVIGSNLVIAVEGDYGDKDKFIDLVEAMFVEMPKGEQATKKQSCYMGGFVKIPHIGSNRVTVGYPLEGVKDYPAAHVLIEVIKSWMIRRFKDYDPEAQFNLRVAHNMGKRLLEMNVVSAKLSVNHIMQVFAYEINRLINEGPSDRRLERSKGRAMGERLGKRNSPDALVDELIILLRQGRAINYSNSIMKISKVLSYDVVDCARTIFVDYPPTVVIATQEADNEHMTYEQMAAMIKVDD